MSSKTTKVWVHAGLKDYDATPTQVEYTAVIYSPENNRNRSYFDVYKMLKYSDKLEKILLNNNHEGKYFSILTDRITSIYEQKDKNGVPEIFATIVTTNPEKVANPEIVTGYSIELLVKNEDIIFNEVGEYYVDYEWSGLAYLLGVPAGSGDTRILSVKTFAEQIETEESETKIKPEDIKEYLQTEEGKTLLNEIVESYESITKTKEVHKTESGTYEVLTESMISQIVSKVTEGVTAEFANLLKETHLNQKNQEDQEDEQELPLKEDTKEDTKKDESLEIQEIEKTVDKVIENRRQKQQKLLMSLASFELLEDRQGADIIANKKLDINHLI